jgi:transmembrane sensor
MADDEPTRIELEAAEWVVKFDGSDWDSSDVCAFRRWVARSPSHRAAFVGASQTWNELDLLDRLETYPLAANDHGSDAGLSRRALVGGVFAGAAALGGIAYLSFMPGEAEAFETGVGELRDARLDDGTIVFLNAASRIEARVSDKTRSVRVVAGEALFVVPENRMSALSILTPDGAVEIVSGEVLVKLLPDGARVTLLSDAARAWRTGILTRRNQVLVEPGAEIEFRRPGLSVASVAEPIRARRTLWREGRLAFDNAPLAEAVADVARQTGARFEFADPALAELRVGGVIAAGDLEAFLLLLRQNLAINAERRDGMILLSSTVTF